VIIGENRSFDHVFATYQPQPGQKVHNLLSEGIIALDADKNAVVGPNFDKAQQLAATDAGPTDSFLLSPPKKEFPKNILPAPLTGGASADYFDLTRGGFNIVSGGGLVASQSIVPNAAITTTPINHRIDLLLIIAL